MKNTFILNFTDTDSSIEFNINSMTVLDKYTDSINISSNEYVPADNQKLYFMPAVNIPRVKLKDLYSKYKIKTVRNIEDATHIFAGKSTYDKLVTNSWYYNLSKDAVEKLYTFFEETNVDGYFLNKLRIALDACETQNVYFYHSIRGIIMNSKHPAFVKFREVIPEKQRVPGSHYIYRIDDDYQDLVKNIKDVKLFDESELIKHINGEDSTTLDAAMYEQLRNMFASNDGDNRTLAMEIMANCNYVDSLLYLEMLFEEYSHIMENNRSKNHVNFKSLLSFLGKSKSNMVTSIDDIVKSLDTNGVLDVDKINIIMSKFHDQIMSRGDSTIFKVKTITLDPEYLEKLNYNYTFKIVNDFIPVGAELDNEPAELHGGLENLQEVCGAAEIIEDTSNEDTTEPLETNEAVEEEVEVLTKNQDPLEETKIENNGDDFEWF